jgi:hypothetical protein
MAVKAISLVVQGNMNTRVIDKLNKMFRRVGYTAVFTMPEIMPYIRVGARGSIVVKALCYKPEGRGFDTR